MRNTISILRKFSSRTILGAIFIIQCVPSFSQNVNKTAASSVVRPEIRKPCAKPEWPRSSLLNDEDGALQVAVKIGLDGRVSETTLQLSSGFPDLDEAVKKSLNKCVFTPGTLNGQPISMLKSDIYFWIETSRGISGANWQKIIDSAKAKNPDAIYILARLQLDEPKTVSNGIELLKFSANNGSSLAQYELAQRYENGDGMNKDMDLAEAWYSRAAESRDILAIERLQLIKN